MEIKALTARSWRIWTEDGDATVELDPVKQGQVLFSWLWIKPDRRRSGAGRRMVKAIADHFKVYGALTPSAVLSEALGFWQRMQQEGLVTEPDYVY